MRRILSSGVLLLATVGPPLHAQQPTSAALLEKAAAYLAEQFPRLSNVVAEERYLQQTTSPNRKRTLVSDYLLVRLPDSGDFTSFRDVFEVDGQAVRDRDERLQKLFIDSPRNVLEQASAIGRESARHNIWSIGTVNNPLLAMAFIQPAYRVRFRFQSAKQDKALGPDVWRMIYQEFVTPTILKGDGNRDIQARGTLSIEASTGRVVQTELRLGADSARLGLTSIQILTTYRYDSDLMLNVPAEMKEWYPDGRVGEIRGTATYGRFRRFGVSTGEELKPSPQ